MGKRTDNKKISGGDQGLGPGMIGILVVFGLLVVGVALANAASN